MDKRKTVFIPVVTADGKRHRVLEIYSEPWASDTPDADKAKKQSQLLADAQRMQLPPVVVRLSQIGLGQAAQAGLGAAKKHGLGRPRCALYQWLRPQAWVKSQMLDYGVVKSSVQGESAELGIALALLLGGSHTATQQIMATGSLRENPQNAQLEPRDTEVGPVTNLRTKLASLLDHPIHNGNQPVRCFIPKLLDPGNPVPSDQDSEIQRLTKKLEQRNILVTPVETLQQATNLLAIGKAQSLTADRWICSVAIILIPVLGWAIASQILAVWRTHPVELILTEDSPFIACIVNDQGDYRRLSLNKENGIYRVPSDNHLGWKLRLKHSAFDQWMSRIGFNTHYHLAMASVGTATPVKMKVPDAPSTSGQRAHDGLWKQSWHLELPEQVEQEDVEIYLAARRGKPYTGKELGSGYEDFLRNINPQGKPDHFSHVPEYLESLSAGIGTISLRLTTGANQCNESQKP